jgi:hypothetical protein
MISPLRQGQRAALIRRTSGHLLYLGRFSEHMLENYDGRGVNGEQILLKSAGERV